MNILGISAFYHDSAAALVCDGKILAAAQEERFSRVKHDSAFPAAAVRYVLAEAELAISQIDHIVFYDKPLIKFERLLETYLTYAPKGFRSFLTAMPVWLKEKLFLKNLLRKEISKLDATDSLTKVPLLFSEHHRSHAASAFFPSPFDEAAVLCIDGVGEWATTSVWVGKNNKLTAHWQIDFPHSLGLLYSAFTYFAGFKVNSGEYKLMGLAPYGEPKYYDLILDKLMDLKADGTFRLDMQYFGYADGLTMTNDKFSALFSGPPRPAESEVTQREMDLAASIQKVTETIVLRLAETVRNETGLDNLCLAGGVALNCVANGRLTRESQFKNIWVQPAAGDAGGALGAALSTWHEYLAEPRQTNAGQDQMRGGYLGPSFSPEEITRSLEANSAVYDQLDDEPLIAQVATVLASGKVVGWFQGRMEFGPRALGGRSILGDPRNVDMQTTMNLKIKYRESFRPFAPSVLAERVSDYFIHKGASPYMLMVAPIHPEHRVPMSDQQQKLFGIEKLKIKRSALPAITHVDYSARLQSVHAATNPRYHNLIEKFDELTGCPVLVNTSFNVRGEPIVCNPADAFRCFMRTEMDYLVIENFILDKSKQAPIAADDSWTHEFELD